MKAIVIAYEDAYYEKFHLLVKALRRDRGLPGLTLEGQPVRGTARRAEVLRRCPDLPRLLELLT